MARQYHLVQCLLCLSGRKMTGSPKFPPIGIIEQSSISPAPGSNAPSVLSLTFFDYIFLPFHPVQRVFFYELPYSVPDFIAHSLPQLKLSLSLALRDFRPLAGTLNLTDVPELVFDEDDTVPFTVAESSDDFYELSGNEAKDCARLYSLVPALDESEARRSVLALQLTLLARGGAALGMAVSHAVADGSTSAYFLKTWAALCRKGSAEIWKPSYERTFVRDFDNLGEVFLRDLKLLKNNKGLDAWDLHGREGVVRATFSFSEEMIEKLGERFSESKPSKYSLVAGVIWASLVKARGGLKGKEYFGFVTGCRGRMKPPLEASYFGNCLGLRRAEADGEELEGEDGVIVAAKAIWKAICDLEEEGPFGDSENWVREIYGKASEGILTVAGSPKLALYQVDFGWGRPRKIEIVSIERTSAMSIAEGAVADRGLEIGIALPREIMNRFSVIVASVIS